MLHFSTGRLFVLVSVAACLVAGWLSVPFLTSVAFVLLAGTAGAMCGKNWQGSWFLATVFSAIALQGCILWEYFFPVEPEVAIGLTRAIPMSLVVATVLGLLICTVRQSLRRLPDFGWPITGKSRIVAR
ncbi:MAG: hypothetical protein AAGG44_10145 [Planctomycetota bacterium]